MVRRGLALLDRLLGWYIVALMGLLVVLTFLQVLARYLARSPLTGTDQMARICLVWLTFMGAAMAVRTKQNIRIDLLDRYLFSGILSVINISFDLILIVLLAVLGYKGWQVTRVSASQQIVATPFSYDAMYLSVVVGAGLMLLFVLVRLLGRLGMLKQEHPRGAG
ncbi:MAG: TRAP transporter small permease [Thermodesulfobacteriota bacterium]